MLKFKDNILSIFKGSLILVALTLILPSCGYRSFFPARTEFYSFDTCRQIKLVVEPYFIGANEAAAFSPINHLALAADVFTHKTLTFSSQFLGVNTGASSASGHDFSVGYFKKYKNGQGLDIFASIGREDLNSDTISKSPHPNFYTNYPTLDTFSFSNYYYTLSIQPTYYFNDPNRKSINLAVGCRFTFVYNNNDPFNRSLPKRIMKFDNFLIEPGLELAMAKVPSLKLGIGFHISTTNDFAGAMWPFTICLKFVPEFGNKTRLNPFLLFKKGGLKKTFNKLDNINH